jgi:hypothetical protein
MQESSVIDIVYLSTDEMTADVLTKPLHGYFFTKHVCKMMGLKWRNKFRAKESISEDDTQEHVGSKRPKNNLSRSRRAVKRQRAMQG